MLKIFREDVDLESLNSLLSEVKKDVLESFKDLDSVKEFFEICFVSNASTLEEEVSKLIGETINYSEFVFNQITPIIEKFESYHRLAHYLDWLSHLATVDETKTIEREKFNEAQQFFLEFREFCQDNVIYSQLTQCDFLETLDFEIENDSLLENKSRFKQAEKVELFEKIKSIRNKINPLQVACEQLNEIFSYTKNISPRRGAFAANFRLITCPYCNINNLDIMHADTSGDEKNISAMCQLDHVLPQAHFPLFESSFWNLVPVCSTCNNKKGENEIHFNSWFISISREIVTIDLKYDVRDEVREMLIPSFRDLRNEEITFNTRYKQITDDISILKLKQLYNNRYKSQGELGELGIDMKQAFLGLKNFRKARVEDLAALLDITDSDCLEDLFSYYFKVSFADYETNHYSRVLYGKIISEFIRGKGIDEVIGNLKHIQNHGVS